MNFFEKDLPLERKGDLKPLPTTLWTPRRAVQVTLPPCPTVTDLGVKKFEKAETRVVERSEAADPAAVGRSRARVAKISKSFLICSSIGTRGIIDTRSA